jgi:hypothetical protein
MKGRIGLGAVIAAHLTAAGACSYPDFVFDGAGGTGGQATTASSTGAEGPSSASSASSSSSTSTSSSSTSSSSTGGPPCTLDHLVISEIRSRGPGGAADEFVELYNPTSAPITLDPSFSLQNRGSGALTYATRWTGAGETIPAHGHFLIAGSGYTQSPAPDAKLAGALTSDSASVLLAQGFTTIDAVCFFFDSTSLFIINNGFYTCEGMPVDNPHDDATGTDTDKSLERRPGGGLGNCTDTDDSASDFAIRSPAKPENAKGAPVP